MSESNPSKLSAHFQLVWQLKQNEMHTTNKLRLIEFTNGIDGAKIERYCHIDNPSITVTRYFWRGSKWWAMP